MSQPTVDRKIVKVPSTVSVKKFADLLGLPISAVITELMKNKIMATINEEIDFDTASIIADDLGFTLEADLDMKDQSLTLEKLIELCKKEKESDKKLLKRPPIITILGHVDHGKTTLLDTIRATNVASGETGGITQHISAYQVKKRGEIITFVDTPGHEAFSAMRERGVTLTDIAVLVVAADDGVRPQTKEVIKYLLDKKIPTIIAINKIDKPDANEDRVKTELAEHGIQIEEWGGPFMCVSISAKNNINIDELLERIILLAEVEEFKADYNRDGLAIVLESHLDPQKGPVAVVLIKTGLLKVGQDITAGKTFGRIRKMEDYTGKALEIASPSQPVVLYGLSKAPSVNDVIQVATEKSLARSRSREVSHTGRIAAGNTKLNKQALYQAIEEGKIKKLNIILKVDVQGSREAIEQIIDTIVNDEVVVDYIHTGVGGVTESDVRMAESAKAIVYGFNVPVSPVAKRMAENAKTEIKTYGIIYEIVEDIKQMLLALLPVEIIRTDIGTLEILAIFMTEKKKMIIGGKVLKGKIKKDTFTDIYRGEKHIGTGKIIDLQHNKISIDEVPKGKECGIIFEGETKIKVGDILHVYHQEEKKRVL